MPQVWIIGTAKTVFETIAQMAKEEEMRKRFGRPIERLFPEDFKSDTQYPVRRD